MEENKKTNEVEEAASALIENAEEVAKETSSVKEDGKNGQDAATAEEKEGKFSRNIKSRISCFWRS